MRNFTSMLVLVLIVMVFFGQSIFPPEKQLRLGKDLRGGTTLVYAVSIDPSEDASQVLDNVISVLKDRVDPDGLFEIQMVAQGQDRIEVTMPLPDEQTQALRQAYEDALQAFGTEPITRAELRRILTAPQRAEGADARQAAIETRENELKRLSGGEADRESLLLEAAEQIDLEASLRAQYDIAVNAGQLPESALLQIEDRIIEAERAAGQAIEDFVATTVGPDDLRKAIEASTREKLLEDSETGDYVRQPSEHARLMEELETNHPQLSEQVEAAEAAYEAYAAERTSLADPQELERLLSSAGVLSFRIAVSPREDDPENSHPEEQRLRDELHDRGPGGVRARDARWFRINDIDTWYDTTGQLAMLEQSPQAFFAARGLVGEEYDGEYWLLLWDTRANRLTPADGAWEVSRAFETFDQLGRPAIGFEMDAAGARRLGELTGPNVNRPMAVILDDEVYTAPNLLSQLTNTAQITGDFSAEEREYVIRVLAGGSLQAKLSPEPLSRNTVAPELGADNLRAGMRAGIWALGAVSVFMIFYYFVFGGVAVISLFCNAILILGAMSLARAAFTLPGIAGVILTFGMAVDANVLIYERIREELRKGMDLRVAVKLGYSKALSSIVDGNITNLIVCFVLAYTGTQEIRGFAITLGIGVVCTLFSALIISRLIFALLVDRMGVKKLSMLPMAVPIIDKVLEPKVNWIGLRPLFIVISLSYVSLGIGMVVFQGKQMLDTEFRGGTQITLPFRTATPEEVASGEVQTNAEGRVVLERARVVELVQAVGEEAIAEGNESLIPLRNADVLAVNPEADGVTSDTFQIKTFADDEKVVLPAVEEALRAYIQSVPRLEFAGAEEPYGVSAPVDPILSDDLGSVISRPGFAESTADYLGGVAVVMEDIDPQPTLSQLEDRLEQMRGSADFSDTLAREREVRLLEGTPDAVRSAVLLVKDPSISYFDSEETWESAVGRREWLLVQRALGEERVLASVTSFDSVIAQDFQAQAIVAVTLSFLLILIYIWVRFGSIRYSTAAIVTLLHDVLTVIGLIALAELIYDYHLLEGVARALLIEPFKIDLNLVAAILTIIGYSLNDTIIIMDRIRENRGKLPYASKQVVNDAINQTISRTVITSGTTLVATLILYIFGGPGVRAFSYALTIGVVIGTYSSIAVAAPLVWSRKPKGAGGATAKTV